MESLLKDAGLNRSPTVANSAMNRECDIRGTNSYARDLSFDTLRLLRSLLSRDPARARLDLVRRAASSLTPNGLFVANLAPRTSAPDGEPAGRADDRASRDVGLYYDPRKHLLSGEGQRDLRLPFRYLGADDGAGPNYTGQDAVDSH